VKQFMLARPQLIVAVTTASTGTPPPPLEPLSHSRDLNSLINKGAQYMQYSDNASTGCASHPALTLAPETRQCQHSLSISNLYLSASSHGHQCDNLLSAHRSTVYACISFRPCGYCRCLHTPHKQDVRTLLRRQDLPPTETYSSSAQGSKASRGRQAGRVEQGVCRPTARSRLGQRARGGEASNQTL